MVIDLKMCRFESAPWGFRLIGGTDFEFPLTVVKVTEGSIADQAGMQVGDIIVRINDEPTSNMSHNDAHDVISKCGNNFFLGVLREEEEAETEDNCNQSEVISSAHELCEEITSEMENVSSQYQEHSETSAVEITSQSHVEISETHEEKVTEEVIAEMISGESEVLKEHNVIGVNFNRIFPKAGICQSSEVFRTLNDEAVKTKMEMEKEKRKWTTFLQKPDRPIPKSKQDMIEEQAKSEPYRVKIVKQVKPTPVRMPTPPPETKPEPEPEPQKVEEKTVEEPLEPLTDSEVPNLEPNATTMSEKDAENQVEENNNDEEKEEEDKSKEDADAIQITNDVKEGSHNEQEDIQTETVIVEKTEEELLLEKQLQSVQQQLLALSSLPSTIQATLDAVTKQLTELLPAFKLQPEPITAASPSLEVPKEGTPQVEVQLDETLVEDTDEIKTEEELAEIKEILEITSATPEVPDQMRSPEPIPVEIEETIIETTEQRKMQEELQYKKQKDQKEQLREELEQRLIRDKRPRRPPRAFGPLTPQERPLILPGGRRWRTPKDAFNDEFIAEVLSSQAELIVGSTLGSTYESPRLGYDDREYNLTDLTGRHQYEVNFLKYQKPEKKIDLEKSEVYKVIHHLERAPRRGIETRPPKVPAEEDIRSRATPMTCG